MILLEGLPHRMLRTERKFLQPVSTPPSIAGRIFRLAAMIAALEAKYAATGFVQDVGRGQCPGCNVDSGAQPSQSLGVFRRYAASRAIVGSETAALVAAAR
ncbi:hypothetical protein HG421_08530 [Xanthomonas campestris pv. badrii]|uniref:Uncharacterized protein n=1 Tax=Xanthomonas campestris pv. badrii TaxID=149696 RepID=A0A7Z2V9Z6_XANCA|nr:hypothetical protein [Xanthomonas campestris]QJD67757.1 hypothetical protein HG421_08530 [Xanthomonas campestris pv. badrii]